jgi:type IV secretion system protein VirB6
MNACPPSPVPLGVVRDLLSTVDCHVQVYSAAGYLALTGPRSPLPAAMTALLTIYVALLGYRLLTGAGGTRLSQTPLIAVKIGVVLAVTLNWSVFQTLVFNLAADAPMQIGRVIARPMAGGGGDLAADPVRGLQTAYDELTADAQDLAKTAGQGAVVAPASPQTNASAPGGAQTNEEATANALRRAAAALLASTAGVLASAFIVVGVLTAVGPVFIALFLFEATRGFFVGWVRALVGAMLVPMVCWFTTSLLLVILSPRIDALAPQRATHAIDLDTAAAASALVLVFAASQALLVVAALLAAGGFRLGRSAWPAPAEVAPASASGMGMEVVEGPSRLRVLAGSLRRSPAAASRQDPGALAVAGVGAAGDAGRDGAVVEAERSRPARLGETYRRGTALRDRQRQSVTVRT